METIFTDGMWRIRFDMLQAAALGAAMYWFGAWLRLKIPSLVKYSVPAPAVGGLVVAASTAFMQTRGIASVTFDGTLQAVFMTFFFCTVGMKASYKMIRKGESKVAGFWAVSSLAAVLQNAVNIPIALRFGLHPLMGIIGGSVTMLGGLGTAGAFGTMFEDEFGVTGALGAAMACATFGMVVGSVLGGPVGNWIIKTHKLATPKAGSTPALPIENDEHRVADSQLLKTISWILVIAGIGSTFSYYLKMTGFTFPPYFCAMLTAIAVRNIGDRTEWFAIDSKSVDMVGKIMLGLFVTMAINSLQLAQLASLALPLVMMMAAQIVLIVASAYFLVFLALGKDYDSAVMACGLVGFGLGTTPNALMCMQALTDKYSPSEKAFFVVPIVGVFLVDISNITVIMAMTWLLR